LLRIRSDDEQPLLAAVVEAQEMLGKLRRCHGITAGLNLEEVGKLAEMRASGTECPFPGGWLVKDTISRDDSPDAAANMVSSSDRSIRSNTASIDDVTRFSPCR
jgi:hypothetical protein